MAKAFSEAGAEWQGPDVVGPVRRAGMCTMRVRAVVTLNLTVGICRSVGQCRAAAGFHDAASSATFDDATQAFTAPRVVRGRPA